MLRLKGEAEDETFEEALPEPSQQATASEGFREAYDVEDLEADEASAAARDGFPSLLRGLGIATATFVPTLLAIFFGLPYLLAPGTTGRATTAAPAVAAAPLPSDLGGRVTPPPSETIRDPFVPPRLLKAPLARLPDPSPDHREAARPGDPRESARDPRIDSGASSPGDPASRRDPPARGETSPATPTLPPAEPRAGQPRAPESRAAEPSTPEPPRQAAPPRRAPEPVAGPQKASADWTPAAAFTDRAAAGRLASSIEQQGYPVEIRQDRSSTRPWVVWIGAQPRSGGRRR